MAATLLLTGAFHEDGLADCVDAFGGAYTRDDALRIMHDSRIGAFGAIALVIALALKWQTLAALPPMRAAWLMIAAHAASRTFAISYLLTLDYVRAEGKAKPVAQRMSVRGVRARGDVRFAVAASGRDWRLGCLSRSAVLIVLRFFIGRYFVRRIGGYTGDCLGFAQQLFELSDLSDRGSHGSRPDSSSRRRASMRAFATAKPTCRSPTMPRRRRARSCSGCAR